MIRALYTSATGMKAQELMIDNTANNLANVNTNGFKRSQVDFADLLYVTTKQAGTEVAPGQTQPIGLQIGSGTRAVGTTKLFTPGTFEQTNNTFDVAIEGDGFIKVLLPNGDERYTRDGALRVDGTGQLVTADGLPLAATITIPQEIVQSSITISPRGDVSGLPPGSSVPQPLGVIQLVNFRNPAGLSSEGGNLYSRTEASGTEIPGNPGDNGLGVLRQKFLERSNVEVVTELVSLITAQRAYEVNSRAIRAGDEMLSVTNEIIR